MDGGLVLERSHMKSILTYPALVKHLGNAFASSTTFVVPERHHHGIMSPQDNGSTLGTLLLMPAWSKSVRKPYLGVKIVSVFPRNQEKGLASVLGVYLLSCGLTGTPLALLNGTELTLWRTACASALAGRYLVKENPQVMAMVGAGELAQHLIKAHCAVHPSLRKVLIWNRTHSRAHELAEKLRGEPELQQTQIEAQENLESVVRNSDLISCATMSETPLVLGKWLRPGAHLDLVGGYKHCMRECDDESVKISRVYVDTHTAEVESGDLHGPLSRNVIAVEDIVGDLAELTQGKKQGRQHSDEITLFKSVGCALEDLAAAQLIYEQHTSSMKLAHQSLPWQL